MFLIADSWSLHSTHAPLLPQDVDVVFQKILQEIEKQFGAQDENGCTLL